MISKQERLGERNGHRIFVSAFVGPNEKAMFSIVMFKGEQGGVAVMHFAKVVVQLRLRSGRWVMRGKLRLSSKWRQEHLPMRWGRILAA